MTVKQLKELLKNVPDDFDVEIDFDYQSKIRDFSGEFEVTGYDVRTYEETFYLEYKD